MNNMEEIKGMLIILEIAVIAVMVVGMALLHRKMERVRLEVDWLVDDMHMVRQVVNDVDDEVGTVVKKLTQKEEEEAE